MKITPEKVQQLAHLARLEFEGNEAEKIRTDLENIVGMCEKLNELDTDGIEPLIYMSPNANVLRSDEVKPVISKDEALKNAPKQDGDFFRVPKFVDQNK